MSGRFQRGFTVVEMLVSLVVLVAVMGGLSGLLIQNSRMNRSQQMMAEAQANARNCLSLVVQKLRSAGWDPMNAGISPVALDPDLSDDVSQIEVFADLDNDGATTGNGEQLLIRHVGNQVEWRPSWNPSQAFVVLAVDISNDADGDGTAEPMFVPDDPTDPRRITIRVTARSPVPDPTTREFLRYTVSSDVLLRKQL